MAVIIRGMDKPGRCIDCILGRWANDKYTYCALYPEEPVVTNHDPVPEHCPISQVDFIGPDCCGIKYQLPPKRKSG